MQGGKQEQKAAVLTEADPLWMELRHLHIADVWISLEHKTKEFKATNRIAAQQARQAADQSKGKKMSDAELKRAAEGLSHYQKVVNKLDQHTTLSNLLSHTMESRCLTRLREFEERSVFNEASTADAISWLQEPVEAGDKLRLLLAYLATLGAEVDP
eukprot:CAMPEP_0118928008 /NCGR_PEP_ID=MMETSP1169-20130426/5365_1 /TAXON_ID=36882 /ORGANISM="Pyramimonas obovata, Strain CCMP722" /LENGTH=156 /DNA_ID=CAMNT_0006869895 /DNA_START=232 /DNA_END=699 /DNA_ORIENTATION=+